MSIIQPDVVYRIKRYSNKLSNLGLKQIAADIDYLIAWFDSVNWNSSLKRNKNEHIRPNPAGKDTIDPNSHNCPIPYVSLIPYILNTRTRETSLVLLNILYNEFVTLRELVTDDVETTAIESYIDYLSRVIKRNGGDTPVPPGPIPPEPTQSLEINLYLRIVDGEPTVVTFPEHDYWYSYIQNQEDVDKLSDIGHGILSGSEFGQLKYLPEEFDYEIIDIYDEEGNHVDDYGNAPSNLYVFHTVETYALTIHNHSIPINTYCYTWKLKITRKPVFILWTTPNGKVNANVSDQTKWALFESDGSGKQHLWDKAHYRIVDYAYYPLGSDELSWQGHDIANSYWKIVKGSDDNIKIIGNDGISNSIAAVKLIPFGEYVELILNVRCSSKVPQPVKFTSTLTGWTVIRSQEDLDKVNKFIGTAEGTSHASMERGFGQLIYNPYFEYTVTAIYSDDGITEIKTLPSDSLQLKSESDPDMSGNYTWPRCVVRATSDLNESIVAYKVRISLKEEYENNLLEFYFTNKGIEGTEDFVIAGNNAYLLRTDAGYKLSYYDKKQYRLVQLKNVEGNVVTNGGGTIIPYTTNSSDLDMALKRHGDNWGVFKAIVSVKELEFTDDSIQIIAPIWIKDGVVTPEPFADNNDYWGVFLPSYSSTEILNRVNNFCGTKSANNSWYIKWDTYYKYEIMELYSDEFGTLPISNVNPSDYYITSWPNDSTRASIKTTKYTPNLSIGTIRLRITKPYEPPADQDEYIVFAKCSNSSPTTVSLKNVDTTCFSVVRHSKDATRLAEVCNRTALSKYQQYETGYGQIFYRPDLYDYELTGVYKGGFADITDASLSDFYISEITYDNNTMLILKNKKSINSDIMAYKIKITPKPALLVDFYVRINSAGNPEKMSIGGGFTSGLCLRQNDIVAITELSKLGITVSVVNNYYMVSYDSLYPSDSKIARQVMGIYKESGDSCGYVGDVDTGMSYSSQYFGVSTGRYYTDAYRVRVKILKVPKT